MGRVSKYKKVKSFDPYSKKNGGKINLSKVGIWGLGESGRKAKKRSRRSEMLRSIKKKNNNNSNKNGTDDGFDLPPSERDEFDMKDLLGSVKKQKLDTLEDVPTKSETKISLNGNVATIPKTAEDERKVAKVLRVKTQLNEKIKSERKETQARLEGESKRAYTKRTKAETRQIIKQSSIKENVEKKKRKKDFLNNKKKNKKKRSLLYNEFPGAEEYTKEDEKLDCPAAPENIHFTEQASRPPMFNQLPRGAKQKSQKGMNKAKASGMTDAQVHAEKNVMELMRRRVQAQYATIKARRKMAGDFHL
jgi:hypothetical protein